MEPQNKQGLSKLLNQSFAKTAAATIVLNEVTTEPLKWMNVYFTPLLFTVLPVIRIRYFNFLFKYITDFIPKVLTFCCFSPHLVDWSFQKSYSKTHMPLTPSPRQWGRRTAWDLTCSVPETYCNLSSFEKSHPNHLFPEPVATVAVVGKYHSGKSFLLNQLMGKQAGFGVGPFVRPQTMGIWMWGQVCWTLLLNYMVHILLDTQRTFVWEMEWEMRHWSIIIGLRISLMKLSLLVKRSF